MDRIHGNRTRRAAAGLTVVLIGGAVIAGCNLEWSAGTAGDRTEITLRMPEEPSVDLASVRLVIESVTLDGDPGVHEVELDEAVTVELVSELGDPAPPSAIVFSGERVPAGEYDAVSLRVDVAASSVTTAGGASRGLELADSGDAVTFEDAFTISDSSSDDVVVDVDLPSALRGDGGDYTLHGDGVVTTASRSGLVLFAAFPFCTPSDGRGVYLYPGFDADPVPMGGGNGPLFSLRVGDLSSLTLAYMPAGRYTAAWTCAADDDDPAADDSIAFEARENLEVEPGACTLVEPDGGRGEPGSC
ncbi:DUF4382 domain-containing protein [Aquisalimonas asiatica]|uniref:DUF4382 domain-containing protein n=1 Tax=Aquisalimonas asiatica TaxID=406100 RepID=A0A1H8V170_9GAMM|nr:DUF4382 domain-containing protein [Aquisalimonas asiatica]SEP09250.1 protein of unknown function [Aquisalimonas asiatica]